MSRLSDSFPAAFRPSRFRRWGVQDFAAVAAGGGAVALASFADTSILSRAYAARLGASVDHRRRAWT
jgi:hypothetical protein